MNQQDLEDQFDTLVEELHKIIRAKQVAGDYSREEADQLADMVDEKLHTPYRDAWTGSAQCW